MGSISTNRRAPAPAPSGGDWFTQNAPAGWRDAAGNAPTPQGWNAGTTYYSVPLPAGVAQRAQPVNQTQPVGSPVPMDPGGQARPVSGGQLSPDEVLAFLSQYGTDYASVQAADAAGRQRYGSAWPQLLDHPSKLDKWQFANGSVYDLVNSSGSPNASWVTKAMPEAPGGHGGGGGGGTLGTLGGGAIPGLNPMTDFMLGKVQKGLERGAAARGILQTGGFQEKLGQNLADYALAQAWQPAFNNNFSVAQLGLNAANSANQSASSFGNTLQNNVNNQSDLLTNQSNAGAAGQLQQGANNAGTLGALGQSFNDAAELWQWYLMNRQNNRPTSRGPDTSIPTTDGTWGIWPKPTVFGTGYNGGTLTDQGFIDGQLGY